MLSRDERIVRQVAHKVASVVFGSHPRYAGAGLREYLELVRWLEKDMNE